MRRNKQTLERKDTWCSWHCWSPSSWYSHEFWSLILVRTVLHVGTVCYSPCRSVAGTGSRWCLKDAVQISSDAL